VTDSKLTDEELQALEVLRKASEDRARIPSSERTPIRNRDKFASAVGLNDAGEPFAVHEPDSPVRDPFDAIAEQATAALELLVMIERKQTPLLPQYARAAANLRVIKDMSIRRLVPSAEEKAQLRIEIRTDRELPDDERTCVRLMLAISREFENLA
jgi:hypothetical protein